VVLATARTERPIVNRAESIRRWQSRSQRNWRPTSGQHQFIAAECPVLLHGSLPQSPQLAKYTSKSVPRVLDSVCFSRHEHRSADQTGTTGAKSEDGNHDTPASDLGRASESATDG